MAESIEKLTNWLIKNKYYFDLKVNLSNFSYFKSGGIADIIIYPKSELEIIKTILKVNDFKVNHKVIGKTTNLLFLDDLSYSCFISDP